MGNDDMFRELCVSVEPGKGEEFKIGRAYGLL